MKWLVPSVWLMIGALGLAPAPGWAQVGYDRPGGDYMQFIVRSGDPAACAARCEREPRCRAWNFAYPGTVAPQAICWLKNRVSPRVQNPCCVSGVRGTGVLAPRNNRVEFGIDRAGGDYRSFEISPDPSGSTCRAACEAEARCRAWTYLRPGYQGVGSPARCYLKDRVLPPRRRPCCVSGVVR
jgi:hypothetical protein